MINMRLLLALAIVITSYAQDNKVAYNHKTKSQWSIHFTDEDILLADKFLPNELEEVKVIDEEVEVLVDETLNKLNKILDQHKNILDKYAEIFNGYTARVKVVVCREPRLVDELAEGS
jgi:hypothetical protein